MPVDLFLALTLFSCVMAFTPGPNNILLAASGVNFGFARAVPHMIGVTLGFLLLMLACGAGLSVVFSALPMLHLVLKFVGAAYMLWLAYKVAHRTFIERRAGAGAALYLFAGRGLSMDQSKGVCGRAKRHRGLRAPRS